MQVEATVPGRTVTPKTPPEFRADHARLGAIWRGLIERVRQVPGVSSAGVAAGMSPLSGHIRGVRIAIDGPAPGPEKDRGIRLDHVTDGYFETIGIRLVAGRSFTPRDSRARCASPSSTRPRHERSSAVRVRSAEESTSRASVSRIGSRLSASSPMRAIRTCERPTSQCSMCRWNRRSIRSRTSFSSCGAPAM